MNYILKNKEAWEEAFDHRQTNWGEDNYKLLLNEKLPFFCPDLALELNNMDFKGKEVAQFCCNNGREILSLMQLGAKSGVGFDIADNIIKQAEVTAEKAGIGNCKFVACNILDIPEVYNDSFDFIMFTVGAITWFEDLNSLFRKVSDCLKLGGILLIHDFHPFMNMLPMPGEPDYDEQHLDRLKYSYFRKEPWIENDGMGYMSDQYNSKTFTSFSHTISDVINSIIQAPMRVMKISVFNYDVGLSDVYNEKGYPLSYILKAQK
ncbi:MULTISPECIES: class I SAM-dependent methyltransferase [Lacrimispora]|jgi:ubiquinone/menaquinone biosynthesis C-methylase UbiE|uniref:class I SAM-dependent methyltransferase n=1 Tax=Lacrimispora TaxID=2719231 RepID=UPI000BE3AACA|nr:class I SAM-dependent methyltransferase [Lacrimispora amygdalina]MDK2968654.1 hypothetical protein [Lacrimispora sp.]